jgi:hypothetical protein
MKAYVGSYGWRYSEPVGSLAVDVDRFTYEQFVDMLENHAEEYARWDFESADWGEQTFEEFVEDFVLWYTAHVEEFFPCPEHEEEFREQGYALFGDCDCRIGEAEPHQEEK